jgi:hypothetical protein
MAELIHVAGPTRVLITGGAANALQRLGFSINGVDIIEEPFHYNVPGDQQGGDDGPPIDVQYMGEIDRIRMELSKWDLTVLNTALQKLNPNGSGAPTGAGVTGVPGSLMLAGGFSFRLVLECLSDPTLTRNYPTAFLRNQQETNRGTKFARQSLEWEAYTNLSTNLLWNTTGS